MRPAAPHMVALRNIGQKTIQLREEQQHPYQDRRRPKTTVPSLDIYIEIHNYLPFEKKYIINQ